MKLPVPFEERMKAMLGDEYEAFAASYNEPVHLGLRVNTSKISVTAFLEKFPYPLEPVPWVDNGFYYRAEDPVTKHPYFHAGLYYIQEPSAMAPAKVLSPQAGTVCLDLCAAPGGKSTQLGVAVGSAGLLVSNDISDQRIKAIVRNVEKFGLGNVVILNESPERIARVMGNRFHSILVDAPCSGEGMFKKDNKAVSAWEKFGPDECKLMQRDIIDMLPNLVRKNSKVVYSTCTFSPEENENQLAYLKRVYPLFHAGSFPEMPIDIQEDSGHIWPHKHRGEGHFIGSLQTDEGVLEAPIEAYEPNEPPEQVKVFLDQHIRSSRVSGRFEVIKDRVYLKPKIKLPLEGLKVVREGLLLGELKKHGFVPNQAFALFLESEEFEPTMDLPPDSIEVLKYLRCETLITEVKTEGIHLVTTDGFPLGWAKLSGGVLKNLYPASWRLL